MQAEQSESGPWAISASLGRLAANSDLAKRRDKTSVAARLLAEEERGSKCGVTAW